MESRIKTAIEFFNYGKSFIINGLKLGLNTDGQLYVVGWSNHPTIITLTKKIALTELNKIKKEFEAMVDEFYDLKKIITNRSIEYNLAFKDGQASIGICSEIMNDVKWHIILIKE